MTYFAEKLITLYLSLCPSIYVLRKIVSLRFLTVTIQKAILRLSKPSKSVNTSVSTSRPTGPD